MPNSIKDMIGSVDWGKMLSGPDARNALIGTALGGALLGGASMMQERDPEESRFVPVRDALAGALLGGIAGYGIPKGLSLFRDPGSLAPDGDVLRSNYLGWGAGGALAGAGLVGTSLYRTLDRAKDRLRARAAAGLPTLQSNTARRFRNPRPGDDIVQLAMRDNIVNGTADDAVRIIARLRREKYAALLRGDKAAVSRAGGLLSEAVQLRNEATRGYQGFRDLMAEAAKESTKASKPRGLIMTLLGKPWKRIKGVGGPSFSHGAHYAPKAAFGIWDNIKLPNKGFLKGRRIPLSAPHARAVIRAGKYAGGGALLAMLAHKWLGPTASDNYRK